MTAPETLSKTSKIRKHCFGPNYPTDADLAKIGELIGEMAERQLKPINYGNKHWGYNL